MQTVIDARTNLDVLPEGEQAATEPSTEPAKKDPLSVDPQLLAAPDDPAIGTERRRVIIADSDLFEGTIASRCEFGELFSVAGSVTKNVPLLVYDAE